MPSTGRAPIEQVGGGEVRKLPDWMAALILHGEVDAQAGGLALFFG